MTNGEQTGLKGDSAASEGGEKNSTSPEAAGGQGVAPEETPAHKRAVRLPLVRMVVSALCLAGVIGGIGGLVGTLLVSGAEWWWAPAGAGCAWLGGVVGLAACGGWSARTPVEWAGMLFLGQFVSLVATGLLVWALLYSSPQQGSLVILPTASLSFVMVWIAFAKAYGVSLKGSATTRGL